LVTGIANAEPLVEFLQFEGLKFEHLNFNDHHEFSEKEIENLRKKSIIVTTEKDFMRLEPYFKNASSLYYLPIEIELDNSKRFDSLITKFMTGF